MLYIQRDPLNIRKQKPITDDINYGHTHAIYHVSLYWVKSEFQKGEWGFTPGL